MLDVEEYVEQAHFFRSLAERSKENVPMQELLAALREEILATCKLPMAIDFLLGELLHTGVMSSAMARLAHYFTSFQTYVVSEAENEGGRMDMRTALSILRRESEYRANQPTPQGIFLYQFETLCRNRLRYDPGLTAISRDPIYDEHWREWILTVRRQIGIVDFADLIYVRSQYFVIRRAAGEHRDSQSDWAILFGEKEGRIALANRQKDPLFLFSALQRQLGYPAVPRLEPADRTTDIIPQLARRLERLEFRLKLLEEEQKGGIDLSRFVQPPDR